jgi:apolipoprotein N-acyltransferase
MVSAFAPMNLAWCGWLALTPAWLLLRHSPPVRTRPLRYGYAAGLVFIGGCFWWIGAAAPPGFIVTVVVLSSYLALWFLLIARLLPSPVPDRPLPARALILQAFLAAAFWICLEWLRGWFLSGFNWNDLGVSQASSLHFRQLAALGGVPLLSFVLVLFAVFLAETISALLRPGRESWSQARLPAALAATVLALSWIYGWHHLQRHENEAPTRSLRYACIQPNVAEIPYAKGVMSIIAPEEVQAFQLQQDLSSVAVRDQPDLLIWPEAITTQRLTIDPLIARTVRNVAVQYPGDLLLGAEEMDDEGKSYNCAYLLDRDPPSLQDYRKIHLVILGEYLPWSDEFPWLRKIWGSDISFVAGKQPALFTLSRGRATLSPFICYEDTQPGLAMNAARLHPDFFVTLTNDSWYGGLYAKWTLAQHLQNALLRTVEHDRPLLRCANNGISCEIDPDGTIVADVRDADGNTTSVQGVLSRSLFLFHPQVTLYERWGDWVVLLSQLATSAAGVIYLLKYYSQLKHQNHEEI